MSFACSSCCCGCVSKKGNMYYHRPFNFNKTLLCWNASSKIMLILLLLLITDAPWSQVPPESQVPPDHRCPLNHRYSLITGSPWYTSDNSSFLNCVTAVAFLAGHVTLTTCQAQSLNWDSPCCPCKKKNESVFEAGSMWIAFSNLGFSKRLRARDNTWILHSKNMDPWIVKIHTLA